jgi:hypothetical protein
MSNRDFIRAACIVTLAWFVIMLYAYAIAFHAIDHHQSSKAATQSHACTEDAWCWNPLIQGNHRGYVDVLPYRQPFSVTASYPQPTTGS